MCLKVRCGGVGGGWWVVLKGTLVFYFGPRLGLKTGVSAKAEIQYLYTIFRGVFGTVFYAVSHIHFSQILGRA